jgi:hypothetical protein
MGVALQASGWISDATRQVSEVKSEIEKHRDYITALEGGSARTALTIATGAITPPARDFGAHITVDTEGAAATDTLSTISTTNCAEGSIVFLWLANTARIVTIQHAAGGAGQITLLGGADFEFPAADDVFVKLQLRSTTWVEIERGFGNSQTAAREFRGPSTPYGFYTTRNAVDTVNDVDISAGACWDTTRSVWIEGSAMTKQLDATWAAGTNAGMLDTGTVSASEGYNIYAMISDVDGSVDYLASLSNTWSGAIKPTNYTKGQIIGFIYRNSAPEIRETVWSGNHCQYLVSGVESFSDPSAVQQRFETYSINTAPANAVCNWQVFSDDAGGTGDGKRIGVRYADGTATQFGLSTVDVTRGMASFDFQVNDSQEIMMLSTEYTSTTITAYIRGYWMPYRLEATS